MQQLRWSVPLPQVALTLLAGVVFAGLAVLDSGPGRLLAGAGALAAVATAARDGLLRPGLEAGPAGVRIVDGVRRKALGWEEIVGIRAVTETRLGLRTRLLELDLDDTVLVRSRRALGADPAQVAAELEQLRTAHPPA